MLGPGAAHRSPLWGLGLRQPLPSEQPGALGSVSESARWGSDGQAPCGVSWVPSADVPASMPEIGHCREASCSFPTGVTGGCPVVARPGRAARIPQGWGWWGRCVLSLCFP